MFEATDRLMSHQTKRVQFERDLTSWNSPERNRKTTSGERSQTENSPQGKISSSASKNRREKIFTFLPQDRYGLLDSKGHIDVIPRPAKDLEAGVRSCPLLIERNRKLRVLQFQQEHLQVLAILAYRRRA